MTSDVYHWKEALGNPYVVRPHPSMMCDEPPYVIPRSVGLRGDKRNGKGRAPKKLHYDRDYVVAYYTHHLKPLSELKWNDLQPIISEAYKQSKKTDTGGAK